MSDEKLTLTEKEQAILNLTDARNCLKDLAQLVPCDDSSHSLLQLVDARMDEALLGILKAFGDDAKRSDLKSVS